MNRKLAAFFIGFWLATAAFAFAVHALDKPRYDAHLSVQTAAPDGVEVLVQARGDSTVYTANHILHDVCIPIVPDSAGATMRVVFGVNGNAIGAIVVVFFPSPELPEVDIIADSMGVKVRRSKIETCTIPSDSSSK